MIIQITRVKNERDLIIELLPIWAVFSDGFVFLDDDSNDGTFEYLIDPKIQQKYNILSVMRSSVDDHKLTIETDERQKLFDEALKYGGKIICLDADEYLDGTMSKSNLEDLLDQTKDTTYFLEWIQYTSENTIRTDGPWKYNLKDRIGNYITPIKFQWAQMHSTHLPIALTNKIIPKESLFIAHLQWLDKTTVGIKQYFWKVTDYITRTKFNTSTVDVTAYDASVADFKWEEEYFDYPLKIDASIYERRDILKDYKLKYIIEKTNQYNIPNLGDWGLNILHMTSSRNPYEQYKVSVITGIKTDSDIKYFERYLENVTQQYFFRRTEHIIIYSEWSDMFEKAKIYDNFKFIKEKNPGVYNAWNMGIQAATTKYITNWNIDDIRHPINTKIKYDLLERNPQFDIAYNYYIATNNVKDNFYNTDVTNKEFLHFPDEYEKYVMTDCLIGPDPMWRKSLHEKVGYFDQDSFPSIGDWEMWIRFARNGSKFKLIPEILCMYLWHDDTVSNQNIKNGSHLTQRTRLYEKYKA